jgi:hypothetical protein
MFENTAKGWIVPKMDKVHQSYQREGTYVLHTSIRLRVRSKSQRYDVRTELLQLARMATLVTREVERSDSVHLMLLTL